MKDLIDYVQKYAIRGECQCGACIDRKEGPEVDPAHSADLMFFTVHAAPGADAKELKKLILARGKSLGWAECDLFDGDEHGYIEIGGWIGDQGLAMQLMGLGALLGLWDLMTPRTILGKIVTDKAKLLEMAGLGYIMIRSKGP